MPFNPEKLAKLVGKGPTTVRTGGKGTVRRKHKVVRKTATHDDKRLKATLNKLSVRDIPAIEEVNLFKDDGSVIHFVNPKASSRHTPSTHVNATPQFVTVRERQGRCDAVVSCLGQLTARSTPLLRHDRITRRCMWQPHSWREGDACPVDCSWPGQTTAKRLISRRSVKRSAVCAISTLMPPCLQSVLCVQVQASIAANTYVVSGQSETKKLQDLLPGIITQLGPDNLEDLKVATPPLTAHASHTVDGACFDLDIRRHPRPSPRSRLRCRTPEPAPPQDRSGGLPAGRFVDPLSAFVVCVQFEVQVTLSIAAQHQSIAGERQRVRRRSCRTWLPGIITQLGTVTTAWRT